MKTFIEFDAVELPNHLHLTRERVREFLQREYLPNKSRLGSGFSPEFSRLCGDAGYIGMTWPKQYGRWGEKLSRALYRLRGNVGRRRTGLGALGC